MCVGGNWKIVVKKLVANLILTLGVCASAALPVVAQQGYEPPLTNSAVVKLVRAGFREKTVIAIIHSRPTRFNLEPDKLIELKRGGVSENVILAMLSQDESFVPLDDEWSSEWSPGKREKQMKGQPGGVDIFGNSQGSRGESRSRGSHGGSQEELTTTGTATVRILRPPAEAGDTQPKLERTPTLNNESVVKLVEAGFSEGTIIKRIEESPAEFDLSEAKIEELRRRRVTDAIIAAMTAAMKGDDAESGLTSPGKTKVN